MKGLKNFFKNNLDVFKDYQKITEGTAPIFKDFNFNWKKINYIRNIKDKKKQSYLLLDFFNNHLDINFDLNQIFFCSSKTTEEEILSIMFLFN